MPDEDGNVAELVELKKKYRKDCAALEADVQQRLATELSGQKKALAEKYAEDLAKAIAQRLKTLLQEVLSE